MPRYIDADKINEDVISRYVTDSWWFSNIMQMIEDMPTVDISELKQEKKENKNGKNQSKTHIHRSYTRDVPGK